MCSAIHGIWLKFAMGRLLSGRAFGMRAPPPALEGASRSVPARRTRVRSESARTRGRIRPRRPRAAAARGRAPDPRARSATVARHGPCSPRRAGGGTEGAMERMRSILWVGAAERLRREAVADAPLLDVAWAREIGRAHV